MDLHQKARDYAKALVEVRKKRLRPSWLARKVFGARPGFLRFEEYAACDWTGSYPTGKPIHSELILPEGGKAEDCSSEPGIFAFTFRPEECELVIMDVAAPCLGMCWSMRFDEKYGDFVAWKRLWRS